MHAADDVRRRRAPDVELVPCHAAGVPAAAPARVPRCRVRSSGNSRVIGDRWGVTAAEVERRYPCDELVPSPGVQLWRGVTVAAPAAAVWPWVRQLQLAPYSYDLVDNLGRRSPQDLRDLPEPRSGDRFSHMAGTFGVGRVLAVTPGEQLTAAVMGAVMSYVLVPQGEATRLLLKVVVERDSWWSRLVAVGDWPMARRQLLNLKRLAETAG